LARQIIADFGSTNAVSFHPRKKTEISIFIAILLSYHRPVPGNDALQLAPDEA